MPAEFASLDDALDYYWDLMLTDPATTLVDVEGLMETTPVSHERYPHLGFYRACCFLYLGHLQESLEALDDLQETALSAGDSQQQRRVQNSRGMVLKSLGRYAEAAQALQASAELCQTLEMPEAEIPVRLNLANLFLELDDALTAQAQLTLIFRLPMADISDEWAGELEFLKARIAVSRFEFADAQDSIRNALSVAEKIGYQHLRVNALTVLGRVKRLQGELGEAIGILQGVVDDSGFEYEGVLGVTAYVELIKALMSVEDYQGSEAQIALAQSILDRQYNGKFQYQILELSAVNSARTGNYQQAYRASEAASRLRQTVNSDQVKHSLAIERHQREQSRLQAERHLTERENELLKASQHRLEVVNEFARKLAATRDTLQLSHAIYALMEKHFDAHVIALASNDEPNRCLTYRAIIEQNQALPLYCLSYDLENSRMVQTVRQGEPLVFHDVDPLIVAGDPALKPLSQLFLPLKLNDQLVAVLSCQSLMAGHFQGDDLDLILAIAPFLTLAVDNARSHEHVYELNRQLHEEKSTIEQARKQIEHLANHDMLTDLPNRRALDERLDKLMDSPTPFAFAYIDLDGFKPINDKYGHAVGDAVLKVISQRLSHVLRKSDFAARIGGDEFVLILFQEGGREGLQVALRRILDSIRQPISIERRLLRVSASIGVVRYDQSVHSRTELLHFSDQAMYHAKRGGDGGIHFYEPSPS